MSKANYDIEEKTALYNLIGSLTSDEQQKYLDEFISELSATETKMMSFAHAQALTMLYSSYRSKFTKIRKEFSENKKVKYFTSDLKGNNMGYLHAEPKQSSTGFEKKVDMDALFSLLNTMTDENQKEFADRFMASLVEGIKDFSETDAAALKKIYEELKGRLTPEAQKKYSETIYKRTYFKNFNHNRTPRVIII